MHFAVERDIIKKKRLEDGMADKSKGQKLQEQLSYTKKNYFELADEKERKEIFEYAEGYKHFSTRLRRSARRATFRWKWLKRRDLPNFASAIN